jgi:hypothetical protein
LKTDFAYLRGALALGRFWPESPHIRFVWACALAVGVALLSSALVFQSWRIQTKLQTTVAHTAAVAADLQQGTALTGPSGAAAPQHPALQLGAQPDAGAVVQRLEQAARVLNVAIRRIEVTQVPPSAVELGRLQLAIVAEGTYSDLKGWMSEWTARFPSATITRLRLQRSGSGQDAQPMLEWSGSITVWSRPAVPGPR